MDHGSCIPCVNISEYSIYESKTELLSHASDNPKNCIKTKLNTAKILLNHVIANEQL